MSGPRTALVIDDDEDIRAVIREMLEAGGIAVDVLPDGIEALEPKKPYDVILLDMKMPVFDGQRLTDYWKLTAPHLLSRVIVLSGYSRLSMNGPGETFARLEKPFEYATLMAAVNACIARGDRAAPPERNV